LEEDDDAEESNFTDHTAANIGNLVSDAVDLQGSKDQKECEGDGVGGDEELVD
jgi:hypothetical protein